MCSVEEPNYGPCGFNDPNFIVNEKHVRIRVDVEGYSRNDLKVKTHGNTIDVSAKKEENKKDEIVTKNFNTSYDIPPGYDMSKIWAKLSDGKLILDIPVEQRSDSGPIHVVIH